MSILNHCELRKRICADQDKLTSDQIYISPYDEEKCLTSTGYDLRVGHLYRMYDSDRLQKLKEGQSITLSPGDTAIILTREKIMMPEDNSLSALIVSKVSMVARGFSGISTKVDPGWSDNLRITVHNLSRRKLTLDFEEPFCTIVFINNVSPEKHKHTKRDPNPLGVPYKGKRTFPWGYVLPLLVLVIPGIVYYMKGEGTALTLSVPISIFITQTLINALK